MNRNRMEMVNVMCLGPTWLKFSNPCRWWRILWILPLQAIMAVRTWGNRGTIMSQNQLVLTWLLTKKLFWANPVDESWFWKEAKFWVLMDLLDVWHVMRGFHKSHFKSFAFHFSFRNTSKRFYTGFGQSNSQHQTLCPHMLNCGFNPTYSPIFTNTFFQEFDIRDFHSKNLMWKIWWKNLPKNSDQILHSSFSEQIRSCWTHDPNVGNFFFVMHVRPVVQSGVSCRQKLRDNHEQIWLVKFAFL